MARLNGRARAGKRPLGVLMIVVVSMAAFGLVHAFSAGATPAATKDPRPATNDEYALLVLADRARIENNASAMPMRWSTGLANAAQYHDWDMITNGCFQHPSCNGGDWVKRVQSYYGNGWTALGENIAGGGTPQQTHDGWMASPGHRANILNGSFTDFGGALMMDHSDFRVPYGTEDFGSKGLLSQQLLAGVPAAAVLQPTNYSDSSPQWQLALNFFDGTAPTDVHAVVDGATVPLKLAAGSAKNGTYNAFVTTAAYPAVFCKKVYFEATRSNGAVVRWPETGAIGLGFQEGTCWNTWQTVGGGGGGTTTTTTSTTVPTTTPTTATTTTTTVPRTTGDTPVVTFDMAGVTVVRDKSVMIKASAHDNTKVKAMEVWVDGKRLARRNGDKIQRQWMANSSAVKPGMHTITVKAFDENNNVGSSSMQVKK